MAEQQKINIIVFMVASFSILISSLNFSLKMKICLITVFSLIMIVIYDHAIKSSNYGTAALLYLLAMICMLYEHEKGNYFIDKINRVINWITKKP